MRRIEALQDESPREYAMDLKGDDDDQHDVDGSMQPMDRPEANHNDEKHWVVALNKPMVKWNDLHVGKRLGSGSFSKVYAASCKHEGDDEYSYAVKVPLPDNPECDNNLLDMARSDLKNEAQLLANLRPHPNVVEVIYVSTPESSFPFVVMSRLHGTLSQSLQQWREEKKKTNYIMGTSLMNRRAAIKIRIEDVALGIANGVEFLHKNRIAHRDIKPENIGFDEHGTVVIFDFGLAREIGPAPTALDGLHHSLDSLDFDWDEDEENGDEVAESNLYDLLNPNTGITGTPRYMAPEIFRGEDYGLSCDTYSFAILLWELITLKTPFHNMRTAEEMLIKIHKAPPALQARPDLRWVFKYVSPLLARLLDNAWRDDPNQRPSLERVRYTLEQCIEMKLLEAGPPSRSQINHHHSGEHGRAARRWSTISSPVFVESRRRKSMTSATTISNSTDGVDEMKREQEAVMSRVDLTPAVPMVSRARRRRASLRGRASRRQSL